MKFESFNDSIDFAWDQVAVAFWSRYPNPFTTNVLTEDVLRRELRSDGSLYTCRLLMEANSIPKWGRALMPASRVPIIEESIVNADRKTLITYSRTISYKSLMETTEKVIYTVEDHDGKPTTRSQKMFWISSRAGGRMGGLIEEFGIQRWLKNVVNMQSGLEHVLGQIYLEDDEEAAGTTLTDRQTRLPWTFFRRRQAADAEESPGTMGDKAKARLKQHIDHAKEKYEETRDTARGKYDKIIDSSKGKSEKMRESSKERFEKTVDNAKETYEKTKDGIKEKSKKTSDSAKQRYENKKDGVQDRLEKTRDNVKQRYKKTRDNTKEKYGKMRDNAKEKYYELRDRAKFAKSLMFGFLVVCPVIYLSLRVAKSLKR